MEIIEQLLLDRRAVPQPSPRLNDQGDCGPCVVAGITPLSVEEVYEARHEGGGRKMGGFGWGEMQNLLEDLWLKGNFDRFTSSVPVWPTRPPHATRGHGCGTAEAQIGWRERILMALDGGYYGIAAVDMDRQGGRMNHWVLICGWRQVGEENPSGSRRRTHQIFLSCSSERTEDEEWIDVGEFLKTMGGYNTLLARPA